MLKERCAEMEVTMETVQEHNIRLQATLIQVSAFSLNKEPDDWTVLVLEQQQKKTVSILHKWQTPVLEVGSS